MSANRRLAAVLETLRSQARPDQLAGMARFGLVGSGRLGLAVYEMRRVAKETGRDHAHALELWRTGSPDARIIAAMVAEPERLTAFIALLPQIRSGALDERNYVKKAVGWALRHIGKSNARLNRVALAEAWRIRALRPLSA